MAAQLHAPSLLEKIANRQKMLIEKMNVLIEETRKKAPPITRKEISGEVDYDYDKDEVYVDFEKKFEVLIEKYNKTYIQELMYTFLEQSVDENESDEEENDVKSAGYVGGMIKYDVTCGDNTLYVWEPINYKIGCGYTTTTKNGCEPITVIVDVEHGSANVYEVYDDIRKMKRRG